MGKRITLTTVLASWLVLSAAGCIRRGPNPATLELLQAAGDQASLTVVIEPSRFAAAVRTLRPFFADWTEPGAQEVLAAQDLWGAARAVVAAIPVPKKPALPERLPGWDPGRSIVVALFEPQVGDSVLAARLVLPVSMRQILDTGLPGVRHRVLLPATEPSRLAQALAGIFGQVGLKVYLADRADPGLKGGSLFLTPGTDGFVAVVPEAGYVRIEILTDDHTPAANDEERIAAWSRLLARQTPASASVRPSPATRLVASGDHFVAVQVRPWRLRDLASQIGTRQLVEAFTHVAADMRMQLLAAGLAMVANSYLMMERDRPEFEDMAMAWDSTGGLRATAVIGLTEHGAKVLQAGLEQGRPPPAPTGELLAWAWSRLDLNAMLQTAGTLPALAQVTKPHEAMQAIQECGFFCPLHLLLTSPFGAARSAIDFAPVDLSNKLPRGFSLALVSLDPKAIPPVRGVAAARFPAGFNTRPIREALEGIGRQSPVARGLDLHTESLSGDELISLSLGLQPGEGLGKPVDAPRGLLGEARVDLKRLIAAVGPAGLDRQPRIARALGLLGAWRSRSVLTGRTVLAESLVSLSSPDKELSWLDPDTFDVVAWDSSAPPAPTKGERCLRQVTRAMMAGFRALAMVAPEQRNLMLAKAVQEADGPLTCALAEADTAELAKRTQLMTQLFLADRLAEDFEDERELLVLGKACKQGHTKACERAEAIGRRSRISLAKVANACGQGPGWGQAALRIRTAADAQAMAEGLALDQPGQPDPAIALDASTPWSVAAGALEALADKGIDRVGLVVRDPGGVRAIQVARPGAKPKADPYGMARFERLDEPGQGKDKLSLLVKADQVLLLDEEGTYYLIHEKNCKPDAVCADLVGLGLEFDRLARDLADGAKVLVEIEPTVPWREAAAVLGRVSCAEPKQRWGGGRSREIVIGPLPEKAVKRALLRKITSGDKQGKGLLAILGTRDHDSAFGHLGADGALAEGFGGLGTRGTGQAGMGLGGLGAKKPDSHKPPKIRPGIPTILGSMSKEIVRRVMRMSRTQFRYCYERELLRNPDLAGKVVVKFVISATGSVQSAQVSESTLGSKQVEACLVKVVKRMRFPSPKGGGIVIVTYPFVFSSAELPKGKK